MRLIAVTVSRCDVQRERERERERDCEIISMSKLYFMSHFPIEPLQTFPQDRDSPYHGAPLKPISPLRFSRLVSSRIHRIIYYVTVPRTFSAGHAGELSKWKSSRARSHTRGSSKSPKITFPGTRIYENARGWSERKGLFASKYWWMFHMPRVLSLSLSLSLFSLFLSLAFSVGRRSEQGGNIGGEKI